MWKRPAGAGSSSGSSRGPQLGEAALEPRHELLGHVIRGRQCRDGEPHVAAAAGERHLRDDELAAAKARPMARGAALRGEGEAPDSDQPGPGRARRARRLGAVREPPPRGRHRREAIRARRADRAHAAECAERGAVAIRLLEAEPGLAGASRCERNRARIDPLVDREGQPGQHLASPAPRAAHRALAAGQQLDARRARKGQRSAGRRRANAHS
jgi:hypothetical protein